MIRVFDITGKFAVNEEDGQKLTTDPNQKQFDFGLVDIYCSNFWAGFFSNDPTSFHGLKFCNLPVHQFRSVDLIIGIISKKVNEIRNSDLCFEVNFSKDDRYRGFLSMLIKEGAE
jgi:hypothetical protein